MIIHPLSVTRIKVFQQKTAINKCLIAIIVNTLLLLTACSQIALQPTPSPDIVISTTATEKIKTEPSPSPAFPIEVVQETPIPPTQTQAGDTHLIRQGASYGFLDPFQAEDIALGVYQADKPDCGSVWLDGLFEEMGNSPLLRLEYMTPMVPDHLEIYTGDTDIGINQIELINSYSGLGAVLDPLNGNIIETLIDEGPCTKRLKIPAKVNFEVDTVLIEFDDLASAIEVAAVEIFGELNAYAEAQVFWRVPLPSTPVDMAVGKNGLVHVITEPNYLLTYDVEGNQLKQFSVPVESNLTSITTDNAGNLVVTDTAYGWSILLSPEGEQLSTGVDDFAFPQTAINPINNNFYVLSSNMIRVYNPNTSERLREIQLNEIHTYTSLAFNHKGQLYTVRDFNWDPVLVLLDPLTGEELDAYPLLSSNRGEVVARDIAIDEAGNIYILFSMNTGQIAIHKLDHNGILIKRFGLLSSDPIEWPEGSFLDPVAISVSPDGRFIIIIDGYLNKAYISAFLLEIDEDQY
jgi:DNA-binding beta-propeller fold protein YncE